MKGEIILVLFLAAVSCINCTRYDQSQSGEFNVQVGLKDLQIIALLNGGKEEYVDYDYAYDYNEMTIRPQNRTTPRPINTSNGTKPDLMNNTTSHLHEQTEIPTVVVTESPETSYATVTDYNTTIKNSIDTSTEVSSANKNITVTTNSSNNGIKCKKGFVLNSKGECELKLHGSGNALLKLVKLSQKLKLRRENKDD